MNKPVLPENITRMLHSHDFGVLSTYSGEYPYTSLISIVFPDGGHELIFPTLRETRKYSHLKSDAHVAVLLDNRSISRNNGAQLYAVTILGTAREVDAAMRLNWEGQFLQRHPELAGFLSQPQTALVRVTPAKIILVEEFQKIREFDLPTE